MSDHRTDKDQFAFQPQSRTVPKYVHYRSVMLMSHTIKVMLKILQGRLQQYVNQEFPHIQSGFRESRGTRDQIASIHWIIEKERES